MPSLLMLYCHEFTKMKVANRLEQSRRTEARMVHNESRDEWAQTPYEIAKLKFTINVIWMSHCINGKMTSVTHVAAYFSSDL